MNAVIAIQEDKDRLKELLQQPDDVKVLMIDINYIEQWKSLLTAPNPRSDLVIMTHDPEVELDFNFLDNVDEVRTLND